ncbi:hypothetical protein [Algicola sagamiensis]|uniref:hypothetical protein n=1 Tax=Algicola sagamiensis TaxID=163869 RepID=UPI000368F619|nr:hypothetical protein [Algicola sagamiensis]
MKQAYLFIILSGGILLTGCSNLKTTMIPQQHETYSIIATHDSKDEALEGAIEEAEEFCEDKGKRVVVLNHEMPSDEGSDIHTAKNIANTVLPRFLQIDTSEHTRTTVLFRCE